MRRKKKKQGRKRKGGTHGTRDATNPAPGGGPPTGGTSQALGPGTPRAPRGGSRHAPPDRRLGKRRRPERGPAESEGAPDAGRNREALPQTTDPPYGPHRPPDHGDGRATPPGSLNLRAGTRELGTRTGAGRTREAQKAGRGARAHPAAPAPPHPRTRQSHPGTVSAGEPRRGRSGRCLEESERVPATAREEIAYHPRCTRDHGAGRERGRTPSGRRRQRRRRAHGGVEGKREKTEEVPRRTRPDTLSPAHLSRNARSRHDADTGTRGRASRREGGTLTQAREGTGNDDDPLGLLR